ncbi:hypothetical protein [Azospirillum isscasi]|uniref:Uncharacterized protein n=1 Tax=Azospirillum isscasi TaxID=3053926 RepID=A0ABU0WJP4_9PROT|nr:hypothetical protein [Azospirillum isscasi]MDQ2104448.1 hypothetical protein [Azospirillum isscasi]
MNNSDVLWAWVAGVTVSLALLVWLSRMDRPPADAADGRFTLPDMAMGAAGWDYEAWERTGGTPPRAESEDALARLLDMLEGIPPASGAALPEGDMADTGGADTGWAETQ